MIKKDSYWCTTNRSLVPILRKIMSSFKCHRKESVKNKKKTGLYKHSKNRILGDDIDEKVCYNLL